MELKNYYQKLDANVGEKINSLEGELLASGIDEVLSTSNPFVFKFTNSTGSDILNIELLDALTNSLTPTYTNNGNAKTYNESIVPAYLLPGFTYAQFLRTLTGGAIHKIGKILMISDSGNTSDLLLPFTVKTYNVQGDIHQSALYPVINTMQNIQNQVETDCVFYLVDATVLTLSQIKASSSITIFLYPLVSSSKLPAVTVGKPMQMPQISGMPMIAKANTAVKSLI